MLRPETTRATGELGRERASGSEYADEGEHDGLVSRFRVNPNGGRSLEGCCTEKKS